MATLKLAVVPAQCFQTVMLAVVFGKHAQAGGTAVHGVELDVGGERSFHFHNILNLTLSKISIGRKL